MIKIAGSNSSAHTKAAADLTCDGVNDQVKINAQINAHSGEVIELDGAFLTSGTIFLQSGTVLKGIAREATKIKRGPGFTDGMIDANGKNQGDIADVGVRDLLVDDTYPEAIPTLEVNTMSVRLHNVIRGVVENVAVKSVFRLGIWLSQCIDSAVRECITLDARGTPLRYDANGLYIGGGSGGAGIGIWSPPNGPKSRNIEVVHCISNGNWRTGISASNVDNLKIADNTLENNVPNPHDGPGSFGIEGGGPLSLGLGCYGVIVAHNTILNFPNNEGQGVEIDVTANTEQGVGATKAARDISIHDNQITGQGWAGITIYVHGKTPLADAQCCIDVHDNILRNNNRKRNLWYGAITCWSPLFNLKLHHNIISEDQGMPGIRMPLPGSDRYEIANNEITIVGAQAATLKSALDDLGGGAHKVVKDNIVCVNGVNF